MKKMKIAESNVKCGEIIIFDRKLYLKVTKFPSNLSPGGDFVKQLSRGWVSERKIWWSAGGALPVTCIRLFIYKSTDL